MRPPWHPLTELLRAANPEESLERDDALPSAWARTAERLGFVRLGWSPIGREAGFDLAFPCERGLVKADARRRFLGRPSRAAAPDPGEAEVRIETASGTLVVAAPLGMAPAPAALDEIADLAAGLQRRREAREELRRARRLARQGAAAAAAAHDVRNELTRALLHAARGEDGDSEEVVVALRAARDLAHSTLGDGSGAVPAPRPARVPLRPLLVEESRAAGASARSGSVNAPRLRIKCDEELVALADPDALARAVRNVVTNALEAAADCGGGGGSVEVVAETVHPSSAAGFDVVVRVRDGGAGLAPTALARFLDGGAAPRREAAQRADSGQPESTGLGTMSLRLALETLGAPLGVASSPGNGTTVELLLRSASGVPPVLVVDPDARRALRRVREIALDGGTAWTLCRAEAVRPLASPDVVQRVECVTSLGDPRRRAELQRLCARRRVPIVWRDVGRRPLAV
ncbi:MAG: ATP-binding protein [Planctomycetota bacterium]